MLTDPFSALFVLLVVLTLAAFALALLICGLALALRGLWTASRGAVSALVGFWAAWRMTQSTTERIAEVRRIGQQARREMEQLSFEFLTTVSHSKRR